MDELLFYRYLNFQKEHTTPISKRLFKLPPIFLALSFGVLVSAITGIWLLCIGKQGWAILAAVCECVCCLGSEFYMQRFQIVHSKTNTEKQLIAWQHLSEWLSETPASDNAKITEIKDRIEQRIAKERAVKKESLDRLEKWVQLLALPLVLVIATKAINLQPEIVPAIAIATAIFIVCVILYGLLKLVIGILELPQSWQLKQMDFFAEDLQGVLDLERFEIEKISPRPGDTSLS